MTDETTPTDLSLVPVLQRFAAAGWTADHRVQADARMTCGSCGTESNASTLDVHARHRIEGASDPDDMQMVLGTDCPACGTPGAVVLSYGPNGSDADAQFLSAVDIDDTVDPIAADPLDDRDR